MRVDQSRHHGLALKLDHLRVRPDQIRDDRIVTDRNQSPAAHRDRLRDVPVMVDGDDVAAAQYEIGGLGEGGGGDQERQKRKTQTHETLQVP